MGLPLSCSKSLITFWLMTGILTTAPILGCAHSNRSGTGHVPLSDFSGKPTIYISWPQMVLTLPPSNAVGIGSVLPKVKTEGDSILVQASYVFSAKPRKATFDLDSLGITKERVAFAKVFWVNPDGTRQALEVASQ